MHIYAISKHGSVLIVQMQLADVYMHAVYVRNVTIIFCFCYIGACGKVNVDGQDDGWSVGM